ncbi:hypothetical protein TNCV_4115961 [Trichonephila clavipes]|nr:hypothetical protein TNCV_4115961 [Trichonephila clavipes]
MPLVCALATPASGHTNVRSVRFLPSNAENLHLARRPCVNQQSKSANRTASEGTLPEPFTHRSAVNRTHHIQVAPQLKPSTPFLTPVAASMLMILPLRTRLILAHPHSKPSSHTFLPVLSPLNSIGFPVTPGKHMKTQPNLFFSYNAIRNTVPLVQTQANKAKPSE